MGAVNGKYCATNWKCKLVCIGQLHGKYNITCGIRSFYETQSVVVMRNYKDGHDPVRHILNRCTLQK